MAAGIIQGTVTTTSGETIEMSWLVDNTAAPTKWYNVSHLVNSAGVAMSDATGLLISTSQLGGLATTAQARAAGFQLTDQPTDGVLAAILGATSGAAVITDANGTLQQYLRGLVKQWIAGTLVVGAGENHLGEIGGKSRVFSVAMSTDTSAYASGDLIADTQQLDAFFRKADGTGMINSITIIDQDAQGVALYVMFHSTTTSMGTENSAPNISDANLAAGLQGIVAVATTDYVTVSGAKVATIKNIGIPIKAVSGSDDLYVSILNATGTPTFTATGLNLTIGGILD